VTPFPMGGGRLSQKVYVERMIEELSRSGLYDPKTVERLALLLISPQGPQEISRKERVFTERLFGKHVEQIMRDGLAAFHPLAGRSSSASGNLIRCQIKEFLGYGNMGPVFAVTFQDQPFALKIYSSHAVQDMIRVHGKFGLAGLLHDLGAEDQPTFLSKLGVKVLAKKPKGIYARCKKVVRIHNVGADGEFIYILMDMLAVDTINRMDPRPLGADLIDYALWAIDCVTGLCHLHVEERRLHLNVRPEAFVLRNVRSQDRLPKYSFFHFPDLFSRPVSGPSTEKEFVLVDHLDTSADVEDRAPKGLATVGSWLFVPPEVIMQLLKTLKEDHTRHVVDREGFEETRTINLKRSQMDDTWALGLTLHQFFSGGALPFRDPKSLTDMIDTILLSKFDFSQIPPEFRPLIEAMLTKDPAARFHKVLDGCPDKIKGRKVMAEALLYKLELCALGMKN